MTSLVTGANGFVGSHVARALIEHGDHVKVFVRPQSNLRSIQDLSVEICYGDLRDPAALSAALRGVHRVFHAAADYRLWASRPEEIYETNVQGTENILEAAGHEGIDRFIHTSSVATIAVERPYALPDEQTETALHEMIGHYKRSKYMAEKAALRAAKQGLPVVIVNPTTPVGPADWKPTPTGRIILDFLNGRIPAYVRTGLNVVPVEDVAIGHLLAAERGRIGERYILGGRNMLLKEILDVLAEITGIPSPRLRIPHAVALAFSHADQIVSRVLNRPPRVPVEGVRMARHTMFVDASKAPRELGFEAGSVKDALRRAVDWYQQNHYAPGSTSRGQKYSEAA